MMKADCMQVAVIELKETVKNPVADRRTRTGESSIQEFVSGAQLAIVPTQILVAGVPCAGVEMLTETGVRLRRQEIISALSNAKAERVPLSLRMAVALSGETPRQVLEDLLAEGFVSPEMIVSAVASQTAKREARAIAEAAAEEGAEAPAEPDGPGDGTGDPFERDTKDGDPV